MCCFNGQEFLKDSVTSVLAQTYTNWELIFWDNCSTDDSAKIINSFDDVRIKYHRAPYHTNLGGGRARSWDLLKGDLIAFLDVDDTWQPDKLKLQVREFVDPNIAIVAGNVLWKSENHSQLIYDKKKNLVNKSTGHLLRHYFLSLPSLMVRRSAIEKLDYAFDPNFSHIADFDLIVRVSRQGKILVLNEQVATWRVRMESQSWAQRQTFYSEHMNWIEKHKHTAWKKPFAHEFRIHTVTTLLKKLYFAVIDKHYPLSNTTGCLHAFDRMAFFLFILLSLPPLRSLIKRHFATRIKKWL